MNNKAKGRGAVAIACSALVAAVVVAAYAAVPSGATQYSVTPKQFAALSVKVTKLQAQVSGMKKTVSALATVVATCVTYKTLGVGQVGAPPSEGYVYQNASGSQVTTALNAAPAASAPVFLLATPSQCASVIGTFSYRAGAPTIASGGTGGESGPTPSRQALRSAFSVAAAAQR
jgi:hypothetical protein